MNKIVKEILEYVIIIVAVLLFRHFLYSPIRVSGSSMEPTLYDADIMILNKIGYRINGLKRFDVVVVNYENEKIIKRVIGLPGEYIEYKDDILYVNGEIVEESYDRKITSDFSLEDLGIKTIPKDKYLVLGDNRPISKDSRMIGLIDINDIVGKAIFRLWPISKIGKV